MGFVFVKFEQTWRKGHYWGFSNRFVINVLICMFRRPKQQQQQNKKIPMETLCKKCVKEKSNLI